MAEEARAWLAHRAPCLARTKSVQKAIRISWPSLWRRTPATGQRPGPQAVLGAVQTERQSESVVRLVYRDGNDASLIAFGAVIFAIFGKPRTTPMGNTFIKFSLVFCFAPLLRRIRKTPHLRTSSYRGPRRAADTASKNGQV